MQAASLQPQLFHRVVGAGLGIGIGDRDVLQLDARDVEIAQSALLGLARSLGRALLLPGLQVGPVALAGTVHRQPRQHARQLHLAGLDALLAQQRQQLHTDVGRLHAQHRLRSEAGGIAQFGIGDLHAQPGEYRQPDLTDLELAAGLLLHRLAELCAEVVGIEQEGQRDDGGRHQHQQGAQDGEQKLDRFGHRRIPAGSESGSAV